MTHTAVVFLPLTQKWFYAMRGRGSFNEQGDRFTLSDSVLLRDSWVEMDQYGDASLESAVFARLRTKLRSPEGAAVVSSQLSHSAVAMKILDETSPLSVVIHDNTIEQVKQGACDVLPIQLIIEEAGGVVHDFHGRQYNPFTPEPFVIARSRKLTSEITRLATT